ncbi:MAG: hypothetical protein AAF211_05195 [Myxococcota bacterium]
MAAVMVALVGCTTDTEEEEQAQDVAVAASVLVTVERSSDLEAYADAVAVALDDADLDFEGQAGSVVGTRGALTYSITTDCFDSDGGAMACDETTSAADVEASIDGGLETARYDNAITRAATWRLDDLDGVPTLTGAASTSLDSTFEALYRVVDRRYLLELEGDYDLTGSPDDPDDVTGTIAWTVDATRTREVGSREADRTFSALVDVTFEGGTTTLVVDGTYVFTVDADTGDVIEE